MTEQRAAQRSILLLTAAMAAIALALHTQLLPAGRLLEPPTPWLVLWLAGLFAVVEILVVHVQFRRQAHSWSMSEVPLVIGLAFLSPAALIAARLGGSALALVVHRRQPALKLLFNLSLFWLETAIAVLVHRGVLGGGDPIGSRGWVAALAAAAAAELLSAVAVPLAISLAEHRVQPSAFRWVFLASVIATVANTSLGLLAVTVLHLRPASVWLVGVVALIMVMGYRGYGAWRQRHDLLRGLHDLARVDESASFDAAVHRLLGEIREVMEAEHAAIVVSAANASVEISLRLGRDAEVVTPPHDDALATFADRPGRLGRAVLVTPDDADPLATRLLAEHGANEAMVVAMRAPHGTVGAVLVADRVGDVRSFGRDDLRMLETLASYATVALDNSRLVGRLQHEVLHDGLTGLPNRTLFAERFARAIASCPPGRRVGLLMLDLDHFKGINDTLGHSTGDLVLQRIGDRLSHVLRAEDVVARFGGDEYTILLPDVAEPDQVVASAERVRDALLQRFSVGALSLEVGASIGVACYPDDGGDPTTLMQRADVAMYAAKVRRSGIERYDPTRDPNSARRLQLPAQLRLAIEHGDLFVRYMPVVDLTTGSIVGVEALARWDHPVYGQVSPDEFIPLAEHGGLISPLTDRVLRSALEQHRRWKAEGIDLHMAVNLSVRSLLDPKLPGHIQRLLREADVAPERIRLEITESCMIVDPPMTEAVLKGLAAVGVGLAIDDFGTGYSSLASLRGLPIDQIKIDRSFVNTMTTDHHDAVIVRLAVELGSNLGLHVVAEGVEDAGTSSRLAELGCDFAQGHYFGAAMDATQVSQRVRSGTRWSRSVS